MLFAHRIGLLPATLNPNKKGVNYTEHRDFLSSLKTYHFGHIKDSIFKGDCNGAGSSCYWGGYAMESKCHTGNVCLFGQNDNFKSSNSTDTKQHNIKYIIDNYLKNADTVPECSVEERCVDCHQWEFS